MLEDIPFWANGLGLTSGQRSQLYIHDPASGVTTPLTAPPFKVTGFTVEDGRILYTGHRFTDVQTLRHGVFIWDAASGETRCLLEQDRYLVKLFALWRDQAVLCLTDGLGYGKSFPAGAELSLALSALTDEQKAEMAKASDQLGALIVSADASVVDAATGENAAHEGKLSVSFSVDKRYEGESVWMVHRKADGSLETAKVAVENGLASMTVDELSPFAVFEQKAAGPADEDGNKPGGSPSDGNGAPSSGEPDGEEPSGDTQVEPLPGKALASTGDSAAAPAALALAIAAAVAAMIAQIKLRRRHDSQTQ